MHFLKAAEVRALVPIAAAFSQDYSTGSQHDLHQVRMMKGLAKCYDIVMSSAIVLSPREHARAVNAADEFLLSYNWLAVDALTSNRNLYSVVPKFHYFWHLVNQHAKITNPRWYWCYTGEDLVGRASSLAHSCLSGTPGFLVPHKMYTKYRIAMHIRWSRL